MHPAQVGHHPFAERDFFSQRVSASAINTNPSSASAEVDIADSCEEDPFGHNKCYAFEELEPEGSKQGEETERADLSMDRSQEVLNSCTLVRSRSQDDASFSSEVPPPPVEQLPASSSTRSALGTMVSSRAQQTTTYIRELLEAPDHPPLIE